MRAGSGGAEEAGRFGWSALRRFPHSFAKNAKGMGTRRPRLKSTIYGALEGLGGNFCWGTLTVGKIPTCSLFRAVHCDSISAGPLHRSASDESWFVFSSSAQSATGLKSVTDEHPRQANLRRDTLWTNLISNQRLRLSSKHPPMKERIHTTTAVTIPAQKTGLSRGASTKKWCSTCTKCSVRSSTASPLNRCRISIVVSVYAG